MNSIKHIANEELVNRLEKLVRTERKVTHLVLLHISEIESRKLFAELGFDSMYAYLTRGLGYSDGAAYRRLQSARLLNQIPEIAERLETGKLNLTQLSQVQKCLNLDKGSSTRTFTKEKTIDLLTKLENKNTFDTQKTLACEMDLPMIAQEKLRPQQNDSVRLELTLSKEQFEELKMAKNLLSHICPDGQWAEVIATLAKQFNQKKLVGRAQSETQCKITAEPKEELVEKRVNSKRRRIYISVKQERVLLKKADRCCQFVNPLNGEKCKSQYQLEVDHIKPLAKGGGHDINNLRILCRTHNALAARQAGLIFKPRC